MIGSFEVAFIPGGIRVKYILPNGDNAIKMFDDADVPAFVLSVRKALITELDRLIEEELRQCLESE